MKAMLCCPLLAILAIAICETRGAELHREPEAAILLPSRPTDVELFAARELARCLTESAGWKMRVGQHTKSARTFWIGQIDSRRMTDFPLGEIKKRSRMLQDDGVCIFSWKNGLVLVGKGKRGPLNAVYTYLEKLVGCRWPEPGREYIPKHSSIKIKGVDLVHNPGFTYRGIAIHGRCSADWFVSIIEWMAKNRMNYIQIFPGHYEEVRPLAIKKLNELGISANIGGHTREFFFPSDRYFADHPEYFALVEGKRVPHTQICYSNFESVDIYAANVVDYLSNRPEIKIASLWPSDGYGFCECEKCKSGPTTDTILEYINRVSSKVHARRPDVKLEFLSYIHYTTPPEKVRPLPYVIPTYCEYWSRNQFHPITTDLLDNAKCRRELTEWIQKSREVTVFSYYGDDCIKRFLYQPIIDVVVEDAAFYRGSGLKGNFVLLTNPESWWSNAPHIYAYARVAWDPGLTAKQIESDYYLSLYGSASSAMLEHHQACKALFSAKTPQGDTVENVLFNLNLAKFDPSKLDATLKQWETTIPKLTEALSKAKLSKSDPFVLSRIGKLESAARYTDLTFRAVCELSAMNADKTGDHPRKAVDLILKALEEEVVAQDDAKGYRSANIRLAELARLAGLDDANWLAGGIQAYKRYNKSGIWRWSTDDIEPSDKANPKTVIIEVTDKLTNPGDYEVTWEYLLGMDGLSILSTGLYVSDKPNPSLKDLVEVSVDRHEGFTGSENRANVYSLRLPGIETGKRYFVVGVVYDERNFDTYGQVTLIENRGLFFRYPRS